VPQCIVAVTAAVPVTAAAAAAEIVGVTQCYIYSFGAGWAPDCAISCGVEQTLVAVPCVARSAFALRPNSCGSLFPVGQMSAIAARAIFMRLRIEVLSHMRQSMKFIRWMYNFAHRTDPTFSFWNAMPFMSISRLL
jgi:hypothetical protein